ncbi:ribosome biogenesis GTP-binding protein YihA/YsxC [Limosilactobacillus ingluviei]|uniref:ribosome biogenesis GTP-binding protein YihA/YsxC n=1 Tax=Limosilactobacillus ingluviei TaxID=148604 RepID=UPI00031237AA|nr:ribosome biogenesis GTP-binding protein YihA/YsxC [Limosilactobacillus ingluviei]MBM6728444.1 YihA family ribosome biogenesis GTP-binding protein [Limosilactobacillus ingluviei]MDO4602847.1 ribosome biogenesis GTP-binding protein YihA/YsxC [Limosilactobacillus ingluviei]
MDVNQVELTISAVQEDQYPTDQQPEIALVGRSNVGKSSLTNVLINRKNFAHTSSQPGKTQTLNFYHVEEALYFVDVPGYGYAKVSKKQREKFGKMIEHYLTNRDQLKGVIELVDGRHVPTDDDIAMYQWLTYYQVPTLVVATKVDKLKPSQYNRIEKQVRQALRMQAGAPLILFSAQTRLGKEQVWDWISQQTGVK